MKIFFVSLYQLILFQKVIISRVGGKTRHTNVQVRDPANDINKSKFSDINATETVTNDSLITKCCRLLKN